MTHCQRCKRRVDPDLTLMDERKGQMVCESCMAEVDSLPDTFEPVEEHNAS